MIIKDWREKIKAWSGMGQKIEPAMLTILLVILTSTLLFGLGWWYQIEATREPVKIYKTVEMPSQDGRVGYSTLEAGSVVASRNGTKYYYLWCGGVNNIKEANRVTFATEALAIQAGYVKAKNCH